MVWSKSADWIPVSNAIGIVAFWEEDLRQSKSYVETVKRYRRYNLPNYNQLLRMARKDVEWSRWNLIKAKVKLAKTLKRVKRKF